MQIHKNIHTQQQILLGTAGSGQAQNLYLLDLRRAPETALHLWGIFKLGWELVHCCSIFLWDLDWKYSARWEPSIWRCRLLSAIQRAQMTDLDQIFCMWHLLCVWRVASKNFVRFLLLLPPQKGRSIRSGCFFQKCCTHNIFGMVFSLYKSRNLSPCQKCCAHNISGRPLQLIQTR